MQEYTIRDMGEGVRCRWAYDESYETRGSYAYDTEDETREAEEWELERLRSGALVALGCIVERLCQYRTTHLYDGTPQEHSGEHWHEVDSLWGIVIEPNDKALDQFARDWYGPWELDNI